MNETIQLHEYKKHRIKMLTFVVLHMLMMGLLTACNLLRLYFFLLILSVAYVIRACKAIVRQKIKKQNT